MDDVTTDDGARSQRRAREFLRASRGKLLTAYGDSIPATLWFITVFMALRFYEYLEVSKRVEGAAGFIFFGWLFDAAFLLSLSLCVLPLHLAFALVGRTSAAVARAVVFSLLLFTGYGLTRYFAETFIPLGADLFGYSLQDLRRTVGASGGFSAATLMPLALYAIALGGGLWAVHRWKIAEKLPAYFPAVFGVAMLVSLFLPHAPNPDRYERDVGRDLATNKSQRFFSLTARYLFKKLDNRGLPGDDSQPPPGSEASGIPVNDARLPAPADPEYPFLREIKYRDVLGEFFNPLPVGQYPNIVFVLVEGLGRDFAGPGAKYGGFTPYLDGLSAKSLYWENGMSNGGRTFAVLPSILGSLPYAGRGLLDRGAAMPQHQTLIGLLRPHGYTTHYFYGAAPGFDNQDIFWEYHGVETYLHEGNFPSGYSKMTPNAAGFSWGYNDRDLFAVGIQMLQKINRSPRLDIYLTSSTHEPFRSPDPTFDRAFEPRLAQLKLPESTKNIYRANKGIFACLLYTDDAIRRLVEGYSKRADFNKTVFIITGDHRLAPIPIDDQLDRFHVPIIVYSPLLKAPKKFSALAVHSNFPPTVLGWLAGQFGLKFPERLPFISQPLSTRAAFSSDLDLAVIRNKNQVVDYIEGDRVLSDGRLFRITPQFNMERLNDAKTQRRLTQKLENFIGRAAYALDHNKLDKPPQTASFAQFQLTDEEKEYVRQYAAGLKPDPQLRKGLELMRAKKYNECRAVFRDLLNKKPNYHDARLSLARTHAHTKEFDTARALIRQVLDRAAGNAQAYIALCDVEYYQGRKPQALDAAREGLKHNPDHPDLMAREARALWMLNQRKEAKAIVQKVLAVAPDNDVAKDLQDKLR